MLKVKAPKVFVDPLDPISIEDVRALINACQHETFVGERDRAVFLFILDTAVRKRAWLPEAMEFLKFHRSRLSQKPFATFTVCITLAMSNSEQYRKAVSDWIQPVRAQVKPVSEGLFAGRLGFSKLPLNWDTLKLRAVVALGIFPKADRRDWTAIQTWAESLPPLLLN